MLWQDKNQPWNVIIQSGRVERIGTNFKLYLCSKAIENEKVILVTVNVQYSNRSFLKGVHPLPISSLTKPHLLPLILNSSVTIIRETTIQTQSITLKGYAAPVDI